MSPDTSFDLELQEAVRQFLYLEARLLDSRDWTGWLDLFDESATYFIPLGGEDYDPETGPALLYEDKALLRLRVARLGHPRAYALDPQPVTTHAITNVMITQKPDQIEVASLLSFHQFRDGEELFLTARVRHLLAGEPGAFKIISKTVCLTNADGWHSVMSVPL
jgi:benzoate/toluate 1,2-dioxygenase beta subunit